IDKAIYTNDEAVQITVRTENTAALAIDRLSVELLVEDADGNTAATLAPQTADSLAPGASQTFNTVWNTGVTLSGEYRIRARVYTAGEDPVAETLTPFVITAGETAVLSLRTATDKAEYHTADVVLVSHLLRNLSVNTLIDSARLVWRIEGPDGEVKHEQTLDIRQLSPGGQENPLTPYMLEEAAQGAYSVIARVEDADGVLLDSRQASFNVVHDLSVAVTGQVQVETETLDPGVPQICTDIISNRGSPPLSGLAVQRLLINPDTLEVIDTRTDTLDLAPNAEQARQRRLDTGALAAGSYACVLRVKPAEEWQTLAFAGFSVNDIGLCRHDRFDNAPPGPEWSGTAVGDTAAGSFSIADGRLQVSGSGAKGLWRNDDFYYVYREAAGDFRIETEIAAIPVNEGGAHRKAGLMLRSGISAAKGRDARLMINLVPNHPADGVSDTEYTALQFAWRKKKDGKNGGRRLADNVPASLPVRVAIEKRGDVYAAYYSEDSGLTWNRPTGGEANGRTSIDMGDTLLAGLGAASYAADTELTAEFDSFSLCALAPPPTPLPRECDAEDRPLDIVYLLDISGSMAERYGESGITKLAAAKEAISVLNLALAERNDGSRAALISFRGYDSAEENRNGSAQVQSGFSDDPGYVSELAQSLEVENETYTATAIGLRRTLEFLQDAHALAHRPMLVWLSDGVPNIDGEGNMDGYSARQVAKVSLYDGQGNFLPHRRVAWSGGWNSALDVYYGKPLADAMIAIEELKGAFPELLIYPVAMTGNGKPGSFSADLLEYAAWQSGASVFGADSADALNAAMLDLFADATCSAPARLADLAASLEGPAQAHTGDTATYTVTVRNHGPFDAEEAVLEASLPAGTILVSITPEQGACNENTRCVFGRLEKGAAVKAELRLRVHEPGLLLNSVTVSGLQTRDPNPANNSAGMETFVTDPAPPAPSACITDDFDNGGGTWLEASVGSAAGAFSTDNGRMRVSGSGAELWKNDDFYYVYREVADDFRMEADIVDIPMNQGGMHRKAGLMIRAGISAAQGRDARIMVNLAPNHPADSVSDTEYTALQFGLRGGEGKSGGSRFAANVPVELPVRIAIEKNGRTYGVFWSEDGGETWQQPQEGGTVKIDMGERLLAGMGAVSYAADTLMTAEFDNFGICEPPPPPPPAERLCPAPERPLDVLYLLDTSGSMFWDYAGGGTKFAAAKEAMLALNALLAQRADGSRAAVMTFDGYSSPEENLSGAVLLHQEFSADLDAAGGVIAGLRMEDRPSKTAAALALQKALALLQGGRDLAHQPLLIWLSDGVPTVDAQGRNAPYWSEEIESIRLYDSTGGFLSRQEAAWRGMYNRDAGVYAGQALADAMEMLERLQSEIEDLLIYPVAIQGDGKTAGTFSEDLLNYAAWRTGTPVFSADNADDLNAAMPALLADSACAGPSPANRAAVRRLSNPEAFGGLRKALADKTGLPPAALKDGRLETAADARGRRYAMRLGKDAEPAPALPLGLVSPAASSSRPAGFVFVYRNEAGEKYRRRVYPASAHPQAVYAAGNESVHLKSDGTLAVTLNGRLYRGVFDYAVTAGPADGRLMLTPRPGDFLLTYPNGDRQKLFMLPPAKTTE
ncbi:MAG: VWA domain-containing protein, partial [Bradyrhizobium sp.]|nr:VWA domain-containing protein [Bradyrhizobium sp.]